MTSWHNDIMVDILCEQIPTNNCSLNKSTYHIIAKAFLKSNTKLNEPADILRQ